jgi:hypothetical protein
MVRALIATGGIVVVRVAIKVKWAEEISTGNGA